MPSSTPKQARFMAAVAHGFKPDKVEAPPMKVAEEFNAADTGGDMLKKGMKQKAVVRQLRGMP
jgi:hypothetical protein